MPNSPARYDDDLAYVHAVGCGSGVSTRALVDAGCEVVALEPSPSLAAAGFETTTARPYGAHPLALRRRAFFARRRAGAWRP